MKNGHSTAVSALVESAQPLIRDFMEIRKKRCAVECRADITDGDDVSAK